MGVDFSDEVTWRQRSEWKTSTTQRSGGAAGMKSHRQKSQLVLKSGMMTDGEGPCEQGRSLGL